MNRDWALRAYIACIGLITLVLVALAVADASRIPSSTLVRWLPVAALFVGLCWIGSRQQVYYGKSSTISLGTTPQVAALLVMPYPVAILTICVAKMCSELSLRLQHRRPWRAMVVNLGGTVCANVAAGGFFHLLNGQQYLWASDVRPLLAVPGLAALALGYYVVDALAVVGAITLRNRTSPWFVFRSTLGGMLLPHVSLVFVGIVFAVLWHYSPALSLLIVVPIAFSMRSFKAEAELRRETVEAVLKMAESIDYRDTGTSEHSKRLADLTKRLCIALGIVPESVSEIVLGARVHDLGKIGIKNDILLKAGPLTEEERRIMEQHPVIGANILASYSAFQRSLPIVRHHHERWDGKGYPDGLKGEEIPLEARIVSVVDAFDSMTADRPYRQGMSVEIAVERLKDGMGTQFDPKVCGVFIQMLIEEGTYVPRVSVPALHLVVPEMRESTAS